MWAYAVPQNTNNYSKKHSTSAFLWPFRKTSRTPHVRHEVQHEVNRMAFRILWYGICTAKPFHTMRKCKSIPTSRILRRARIDFKLCRHRKVGTTVHIFTTVMCPCKKRSFFSGLDMLTFCECLVIFGFSKHAQQVIEILNKQVHHYIQ